MSLINDALKKVSEAERGKSQTPPDFEMRALQPAPDENRSRHLLWIPAILLVGVIGIVALVVTRQRHSDVVPVASVAAKPVTEAEKPVSAPVEAKTSPVVAAVAVQPPERRTTEVVPATPASTDTIAIATPAPVVKAAPAPALTPVTPPAPTFRLKGILYTKNPTALINDASVHVGGEVDGATVTKIEPTAVAIEYEGKAITLKIAAR